MTMKHNRKIAALLCCILCLCLFLTACKNEEPTTAPTTQAPKDAIYTVTAKTAGGMIFEGLQIYIYEDNTEEDLLTYGTLDANGSFTFTAPESDKYTLRFDKFPAEGYDLVMGDGRRIAVTEPSVTVNTLAGERITLVRAL